METYLFWLAVFAMALNVVQCVKARKDKARLEVFADSNNILMDKLVELTNKMDVDKAALDAATGRADILAERVRAGLRRSQDMQPRLDAFDWICHSPCGRTTRSFLKFASTKGIDGAIKEFLPEIRREGGV